MSEPFTPDEALAVLAAVSGVIGHFEGSIGPDEAETLLLMRSAAVKLRRLLGMSDEEY